MFSDRKSNGCTLTGGPELSLMSLGHGYQNIFEQVPPAEAFTAHRAKRHFLLRDE